MEVPNGAKPVQGLASASSISGACLTVPLGGSVAQTHECDMHGTVSNFRLHANVDLRATTTSAKDASSSPEFTIDGEPNLAYEFSDKLHGLVGTQLYVILANDTEIGLPVYVGFPGMPSARRTYSYGKRVVRTMSCL